MNSSEKNLSLTQKMKDYLVGIYNIEEEKPVARIGEIAAALGVKGPSAHMMVKTLAERGLVVYEKYGYINLTEEGRQTAKQLKNKNDIIKKFFIKYLGIDKQTATEDANKAKNVLSSKTFNELKKFIYFLENRTDHQDINCPQEVKTFAQKG